MRGVCKGSHFLMQAGLSGSEGRRGAESQISPAAPSHPSGQPSLMALTCSEISDSTQPLGAPLSMASWCLAEGDCSQSFVLCWNPKQTASTQRSHDGLGAALLHPGRARQCLLLLALRGVRPPWDWVSSPCRLCTGCGRWWTCLLESWSHLKNS